MPLFQDGDTAIYYEVRGRGTPLLLLPPGGMGATIEFWQRTAFNAVEVFAEDFRVIAIDQRNSGRSCAPMAAEGNPWDDYLADHIGLLNHLGIDRCHVLGCCIGVSYALNLACKAPGRVMAAVLEQPVGINDNNRSIWPTAFQKWADALLSRRPELDRGAVESFGRRMWKEWKNDFVLSVTREEVQACRTPMLVLPGTDLTHPVEMGHEIAKLAPRSEVLLPWKEPADLLPATMRRIRAFLQAHTLS